VTRNWKGLFLSLLTVILAFTILISSARIQAKAKRLQITWVPDVIQPVDPDGAILKWLENKFDVDIEVWTVDHNKFDEMVSLKMAAGKIPDFFRISKTVNLISYRNQGVLAVIPDGYLPKYAPHIYKCIRDNAPLFLNAANINGQTYGIPSVNSSNIFRLPLVYREDWMKKVGVTKTPNTLAEFESLMYKFAREDPDGNGQNDTYGLSYSGIAAVCGAFGVPINRAGKDDYFVVRGNELVNAAIAPELKSALAVLNRWYKDGVIDPEFITGENAGGYWALSQAFINGRIGFSCLGNYYHWIAAGSYVQTTPNGKRIPCNPGAIAKEISRVNPAMKWIYGLPLRGPTGIRSIFQYNRLMNFSAFGKQVEREPRKMQKILQILDFTSANPNLDERITANLGIQGKHWAWIDQERGETNILPPYDRQNGYNHKIGAGLSMDMPFPPKSAREEWAFKNKFDQYGLESAIQISLPAMAEYGAQLIKMRDQMIIQMITGDKPLAYFDQYVKEYLNAGGAEVKQEVNQWHKASKK
jgi:putative aldouronate transport system substrate-binding protein